MWESLAVSDIKVLLNHTVTKIYTGKDGFTLIVEAHQLEDLGPKVFVFRASKDCCNPCWIEHVEPFHGLVRSVRAITTKESGVKCGKDAYDCNADNCTDYNAWKIMIKTNTQSGSIEYRYGISAYYGGEFKKIHEFSGSIWDYFGSCAMQAGYEQGDDYEKFFDEIE
jgi:hypothetical protein